MTLHGEASSHSQTWETKGFISKRVFPKQLVSLSYQKYCQEIRIPTCPRSWIFSDWLLATVTSSKAIGYTQRWKVPKVSKFSSIFLSGINWEGLYLNSVSVAVVLCELSAHVPIISGLCARRVFTSRGYFGTGTYGRIAASQKSHNNRIKVETKSWISLLLAAFQNRESSHFFDLGYGCEVMLLSPHSRRYLIFFLN